MHRLVLAACTLSLVACSGELLTRSFDRASLAAACGTKSPKPPIGGASDAVWASCGDERKWQAFDGSRFHEAKVPDDLPALAFRVAADKALWVTSRDPQVVTATNARRLVRLGLDGKAEDRTAEVSATREDTLELLGTGGVVVVRNGSALFVVDGAKLVALPAPMVDLYRVLGVLPVLGTGSSTRFFLHLAEGAGSPGTPDLVRLYHWDGGAWKQAQVSDESGYLRTSGFPRLFVPLDGNDVVGLATQLPPQDRVVTCTFARWDGTTLKAQQFRLSVEVGYFGPQQLLVRQDKSLLVLGNETEGDTSITSRLSAYRFTGEDFRRREELLTVQSCEAGSCERAASDPALLSDGGVLYSVTSKDGFEVWTGKP